MRLLFSSILLLLASGCAFGFEPSIEPLVFPTAPPQPFGSPPPSPLAPKALEVSGPEVVSPGPVPESSSALPPIDLSALPLMLLVPGLAGTTAALLLSFYPLRLSPSERACTGAVIAGILGFFSLFAMDAALARTATALAGAGPVGLLLDLFIVAPLELVVIDLHVGFISLAYHASDRSCDGLTPKEYFLPPWGFAP